MNGSTFVFMPSATNRFLGPIILCALSLIPLSIVIPSAFKNGTYALLLLIAIYLLSTQAEARKTYSEFKLVAWNFALYLPYSLMNIWLHDSVMKTSDNGAHFLFFLVVAVCFREARPQRIFWCGLSAAALAAGVIALYQRFGLHILRPYGMYGVNEWGLSGAIKFGMVTTVLSLLAMLAALDRQTPMRIRLLHGVAAFVGFAGCQVIGSRGPWVALVAVGIVLGIGKILGLNRRPRWLALGISVLGLAFIIGLFHHELLSLFSRTKLEVMTVGGGDFNISLGHRMLMWKAALALFTTHPLFGVGMNQFGEYLQQLVAAGQAPAFIAVYGHPHNEYLEAMVSGGIVGLAYFLLLLGAPFVLFVKHLRRLRALDKNTSMPLGGLVTILCFAMFSFGDNIFDRQMTTSLFAFLTLGFTVMTIYGEHTES